MLRHLLTLNGWPFFAVSAYMFIGNAATVDGALDLVEHMGPSFLRVGDMRGGLR
jgi:hypothetical protein